MPHLTEISVTFMLARPGGRSGVVSGFVLILNFAAALLPVHAGEKQRSAEECWQVHYMQGAKAGYTHNKARQVEHAGARAREVEMLTVLHVTRFGQQTDIESRLVYLERSDASLIRFDSTTNLGNGPSKVSGQATAGQLEMKAAGQVKASTRPLKPGTLGFSGIDHTLKERPMRPGEKRQLDVLMPLMFEVGHVELSAHDYEQTKLLTGSQKLLKIASTTHLGTTAGAPLEEVLWTDAKGRILKQRSDAMHQETYLTTREMALDKTRATPLDLGLNALVKVNRPIPDPYAAEQIRYRVRSDNADPLAIFASSSRQQLKTLGPHEAELTVLSGRILGRRDQADPNPPQQTREASALVQSNDPRIQQMAREAAEGENDPARLATRLEKYVCDAVTEKNFSQAFSSAAEVAKTRAGDCTEHAVLLAALARALQIPSRLAVGLIYVAREQAFGFHMWTEVYVAGRWRGLDGTLGKGYVTAAHIKLLDTTLAGDFPYADFLPVAQAFGRIKIDVLEVK